MFLGFGAYLLDEFSITFIQRLLKFGRSQFRTGMPGNHFQLKGRLCATLVPPLAPGLPIVAEIVAGQPDQGDLSPPAGVDVSVIKKVD